MVFCQKSWCTSIPLSQSLSRRPTADKKPEYSGIEIGEGFENYKRVHSLYCLLSLSLFSPLFANEIPENKNRGLGIEDRGLEIGDLENQDLENQELENQDLENQELENQDRGKKIKIKIKKY